MPRNPKLSKPEQHGSGRNGQIRTDDILLPKKYDEFGFQTRAIPPTVAEQAMAARALLAPFGITILEAASRIVAMEQQRLASVKIESGINAFKEAKEEKSDKHRHATG